jgi:spermidine synthase
MKIELEGEWEADFTQPDQGYFFKVKEIIFHGRSKYQEIKVVDSYSHGKGLILDGVVQAFENDEYIYHESLVHPALLIHENPRHIAVLGAGDGGAVREVLKHATVEEILMVELDKMVIDVCREHLPEIHQGVFDSNKLHLIIDDARNYMTTCDRKFDVIIVDLTDPSEQGPSQWLYTFEFFQVLGKRLNNGGIISIQCGAATRNGVRPDKGSGPTCLARRAGGVYPKQGLTPAQAGSDPLFGKVIATLKGVFDHVYPYATFVPSFSDLWGFALACPVRCNHLELANQSSLLIELINRRIPERIEGKVLFLDGIAMVGLFALSKEIRSAISETHKTFREEDIVS